MVENSVLLYRIVTIILFALNCFFVFLLSFKVKTIIRLRLQIGAVRQYVEEDILKKFNATFKKYEENRDWIPVFRMIEKVVELLDYK